MKLKKFGTTEQRIYDLVYPVITEMGYIVWDVRYEKEGASWYLRIFIDTQDGHIGIQDCERVTTPVSDLLDEADPIPDSYIFEVGSAGAERELRRPGDFEQFMGSEVELRLYKPQNGSKVFVGELAGYDGGDVTLKMGEKNVRFAKDAIALVKLHISI